MRLPSCLIAVLLVAGGCGGPGSPPEDDPERDAVDGGAPSGPVPEPGADAGASDAPSADVAPEPTAPQDPGTVQETDDSSALRRVSLGPAVGRRLSKQEYFNSIESVFGVALERDAFGLPDDARAPHGFRNSAEHMLLSQAHAQAYFEIGAAVAERLDRQALIAAHASCPEPLDPCFESLVENLGELVLRGPLSEVERDGFMLVFKASLDAEDQWDDGVKLLVQAMLQSPRFVYRLEVQAPEDDARTRAVSPYELATRLSFLIWNAAPDAELIASAKQGALDEDWDRQVERLLAHPFARRALSQYVEQWLHLDSIPSVFSLAQDMKDETYRLFDYLLWDQEADLTSVFTAQRMEVSGALARFYGLDAEGDEVQVHDVSMFPYRSGFLSNAGVIIAHTINPSASMIDRGLFMIHDVLCQEVPAPVGEALQSAIAEQAVPDSSGLSQRERFAMQRENPLCAGCHGRFDPLGEAFEVFDAVGQYATEDMHGNALTGHAHVMVGDIDVEVEDFQAFTEALSKSETVARCMVEKSIQHAFGRELGSEDSDLIDEVYADHGDRGRSYAALLRAIAAHETFRVVEVAE